MNPNIYYALLLIFYIAWIWMNVEIADKKNVPQGTTLILSIFLSPLIGYLYVLAMPDRGKDMS